MATTQTQKRPVSDLEYDLLTVLHDKAKATKAYEQYIKDAEAVGSQPCAELLRKLQEQEIEQSQEIRHHLQEVMQKGKM